MTENEESRLEASDIVGCFCFVALLAMIIFVYLFFR